MGANSLTLASVSSRPYDRIWCASREAVPAVDDPRIERLLAVLLECAERFAERCRAEPRHGSDSNRTGSLLCAAGIGVDEASGFLRALDNDLVTLAADGNFRVPGARACSPNLHLVGREGDGVKLHNEVLIHVAAYAELVLDHGWKPDRLVFDPFFGGDALDIWGYARGPKTSSWRDGGIIFAAEAKSRVQGADGLKSLLSAFERLNDDRSALVPTGQRRKWEEVRRLTSQHPIQLLLVADGARWLFSAAQNQRGLLLERASL